ncbi:MAG: hypothetical protein DHS20C17_28280 [Cyclobacteriaceae bacterium]|nr:MAG: hypothetical protein DHS20C17_28280 [Cyclobacteriaceae bacterium]
MRLFKEGTIDKIFHDVLNNIRTEIDSLRDSQILSGSLSDLSKSIADSHQISELEIDLDNRMVDVVMVDVPGTSPLFPPGTDVMGDQLYPCARVNYGFTIDSGDLNLLSLQPTAVAFNHDVSFEVDGNQFTIGYQTRNATLELSQTWRDKTKEWLRVIIDRLREVINASNKEVQEFNSSLQGQVSEALEAKREELQRRKDQNDDLNKL